MIMSSMQITMSSISIKSTQVQACLSSQYPTTINKHLILSFQPKSRDLFANKKTRLSKTKLAGFSLVPQCKKSSNSENIEDDDDNVFGRLSSLINVINNQKHDQPPSDSKDTIPQWQSDLLPIFLSLDSNKIMWGLFYALMAYIGQQIEFVIRPMGHDGLMNLGIKWNLELKGITIPLGKKSGIYISHGYQGQMFLRNASILLQPLVFLKLILQKIEEIIGNLAEKIPPSLLLKVKSKAAFVYLLLSIFFMAMSLILWKNTSVV